MKYTELPAPGPLTGLVHCIWFLEGRSAEYQPQPVVPDGRIELLVHGGDPFRQLEKGRAPVRQASLLAAGQLTCPLHLTPGDTINVVGVRLNPLGAHALLGTPLHQITDRVVPLGDVHKKLAARLEAPAMGRGSQRERATAIGLLLRKFIEAEPSVQMEMALRRFSGRDSSRLPTTWDALGVSRRTLERRFQEEVGLSPKMHASVVRFRRAFALFSEGRVRSGSRIALESGYYDQAHLIRDFRRFAGLSPQAFFSADAFLARAFLAGDAAPPA